MTARHVQPEGDATDSADAPRSARNLDEAAIATDLVQVLHSWLTDVQPTDEPDQAAR